MTKNLFRSSRGHRWVPDADSVNAPENALLRADNMVPDPEGLLALRPGSRLIYSGMQDRVHTIHSAVLAGRPYRFTGCDDRVYRNGQDFGQVFTGDGDIAMGDDSYQAFFARATTKKKFDGNEFHNFSIAAPEYVATLAAVTALTTEIASFNSAESPAFTINEGTGAFVAGHDGTANGALKLTPGSTNRASASKKFASDQDLFDIMGAEGGSTDLFDVYVWMEEPRDVDRVTIMFGMGTGADPFKDDYYYFDFLVKDAGTVDIKDPGAAAAAAYSIYADRIRTVLSPGEITDVKNVDQVTEILKRLGRFAGPRSRERKDPQENSPAWSHLTVTRGQFNRVGGTAGRDWKTIRGFKVVYTGISGTTKVIQFDSAVMTGGGNRALTGRYRLGYRYVRRFADKYLELSPMSPLSANIDLTQQALQVTIPAGALAGKDPQVNQIWVYLMGGFLDTFYRFAVVAAVTRQGMTIDELTNPAGSNFNTATERTRLTSWGFSISNGSPVAADLVLTLRKSELEALIENETLEPGCVGVPDDVVAITGPLNSRMFVVTREGRVYPSSQESPSNFSLYHHLDLRRYGTPLWSVLTSGGIYVGMTKDIIRIAGTGDESADKVTADIYPEPLHVGNPPIDEAILTDGNSVVYRSTDGLMLMTGVSVTPLPSAGTSLLWKDVGRHGVDPLNIREGRFRVAMDNHVLYMIAPEGSSYTAPLTDAERVSWTNIFGYTLTEDTGVLERTDLGGSHVTAEVTKRLMSGNGYVEYNVFETGVEGVLGLSHVHSNGVSDEIDYGFKLEGVGSIISVIENGVGIVNTQVQYFVGDVLRVEVDGLVVKYKINSQVVYSSSQPLEYPLYVDLWMYSNPASFNPETPAVGPVLIYGDWRLRHDGSHALWRYYMAKQQWARSVYSSRFLSLHRDAKGALLAGTDEGGELWELDFGDQDEGENIDINIRTPIDDGGDPLARKDVLDLQLHTDTGGQTGQAAFALDGAVSPTVSFPFSTNRATVYRANALAIGAVLKAQMYITGAFRKFLLHAYNLTYRNRVQHVMVLDTGTIQPQGTNQMTWLIEGDIDCISYADLEVDLYLDDVLKYTGPVVVKIGKRSIYRFELPRGSKARAPRLVFRTTAADGQDNPGFEPYRVRVRDRGTGTQTDNEFRPIWPVGEAP